MSARGSDLATRMVDLLDDTSMLADARDMARLLVALFAETIGAHQVSLQVIIEEPKRFATLGVLGHQHFASTLLVPADAASLVPLLHSTEPLWARTRRDSHDLMRRTLGESTDRLPAVEASPPHLLATPLRTPHRVVGTVILGSGPAGFRLGDTSLVALLARFSASVLARAETATVFDDSGRLTTWPLLGGARHEDRRNALGSRITGTDGAGADEARAAAAPARSHLAQPLTTRQVEVLVAIAEGATNAQIAADLTLSIHTVRTHRRRLMEIFEAHTSTALVARARADGVLPA